MPRPITIDDLLRIRWVSDPQPSPDGARVAYTLTAADRGADAYRSHLWVASAGGEARQFTTGAQRDGTPRWSPDGRWIAFLSDRGAPDPKPNAGKTKRPRQVWIIAADGGEARQVTSLRGGVTDVAWSPDSARLAICARVGADDGRGEEPGERSDVRVITRIRYKADGEGFWDGRWLQILVVPASGGDPAQVTSGEWDHAGPAWSPDGRWLAFTGNPDPDADLTNVTDVFVVAATGGEPRRLTRRIGPCAQPAWSPDGGLIAYVGHDNRAMGATEPKLWVVPAAGGEPRCLTADYDRGVGNHVIDDQRAHPNPGPPAWSADGSSLYVLVGEGGTTQLASVALDGAVRLLTAGDHEIYTYAFDAPRTRVAYGLSDPRTPGDLWLGDLGPDGLFSERLTRVNRDLLDEVALSEPEPFTAAGVNGWPVEGWALRPIGFEEGRAYPAIFQIHGGPHSAYGWAFFHEFQVLAAQGFAVVYCNPRGSRGYGQAFTQATHHDWGGDDYRDLMLALDQALDRFPFLDRDRLGVAGGSYGGFMTNWVVTQTDRFKAAVTMRSICNHSAQWGTSDLAYMKGFWEFPGEPWDNPDWYWRRSPLAHVARVRTPVLVLHSEHDLRCPVSEGEQWFVALKKAGVETVFVRFPDESHDLSRNGRPGHRLERLRWIVKWFAERLQGARAARLPEAAAAAGGEQ